MGRATPTLDGLRERFAFYRRLAEGALAQVSDSAFFATLGPLDPIAIQVKHLAGNYRSRWTDFLTADGNKPDRHRDREFELEPGDTREALMARWAEGWRLLDDAFDSLTADGRGDHDALALTVTIRAQPHAVSDALFRALGHTAYHVGQIVLLAKHAAGDDWQTLSIPRGGSAAFEAEMHARYRSPQDP